MIYILFLFAALVGLLGGASRYDAFQIVPLRASAALFLIPAVALLSWKKLKSETFLVCSLGILVILVAFQLIPLPPSIWHTLPARGPIAEMDALVGDLERWRPLTLAPMRTWNALGSLIVPVAGLLLALAVGARTRKLLQIIAGLGVANAALGLLQVVSGRSSPLYLYELTNRGSAVGLLANENHSAVFAVCSLLVVVRLGLEAQRERQAAWLRIFYPAAFGLIFLVALVSGSRAGFAASMGAVLIAGLMVWLYRADPPRRVAAGRNVPESKATQSRLFLLLPVVAIVATVGAFIALGRLPAVQDLMARDSFADLRWSILPIIQDMAGVFWLTGTGFGSFEQVFHIFEPSSMLFERYVNQAHNDWLQIVIEGGILAVLLLAGLVAWVTIKVVRLSANREKWVAAISWIGIFGVLAAASLVDYPLRTPIFQLATVWFLLALSREGRDLEATEPAF